MDFRRKVLKNNPILNGEFKVDENLNELVAEILCQNSENVHKHICLQRNCENCGVNNSNLMEEENVDNEQFSGNDMNT
jgi:bacterioferritin-associated ferredoxin